MILTLTPAYSRDYKSAKAATADWTAGKDFHIEPSGVYTSIRDIEHLREEYNLQYLHIRYKCLSRVCVVKL